MIDTWSDALEIPDSDETQNLQIVSGEEEAGVVTLVFERDIDTGDAKFVFYMRCNERGW